MRKPDCFLLRSWALFFGVAISALCTADRASAQYAVVQSCPTATDSEIYAVGQTGRAGLIDVYGNICTSSGVQKYTYSTGVASYAGYSNPTDFFAIRGSASKTIKVLNIRLSGYATSNNNIPVALVKRSTANTGGTPTLATLTPMDSLDPAPTAAVISYGSAPTLGTLVGPLCACQVELPSTTGVGGSILEWIFNRNNGQPLVLRGANEMAALNAYGVSFPGGTQLNITVTWVEE